ncbi:MAG TPA: BhlA/UviB family holin-like peptide [Bacillota bacterium]|nr:BhlA/UviB family holin-like peptide [Bacillota bacterium]
MEQEIIKLAASQGLWAVLFVALLFYVLKENAKREDRLMVCLEKMGTQFDGISKDLGDVKDEVKEIRDDVKELKGRVGV